MATATRTEREAGKHAAIAAQVSPDREIVQERVFDAPRELVWKAWTDPRHIDQWWGPNGFRNQTFSMDFKVGGTWRFVMHGPDGKDWPNWVRYEEISAPERLVYAHGGEGDEAHFHVTVIFTEQGRRTKVSMRSVFPTAEACEAVKKFGAIEGGRQTLARLAGHLPYLEDGSADRSMVLTRLFDAPPKLVFEAWSTPAMLARWWGPKGFTLPVCELDFRPGGAYRMVMRGPDGNDYPFHGDFREIVPNQRIVFHAVIEHAPGVEVLTTVTFVEEDGKTRLTVRQDVPAMKEAAAGQRVGWTDQLEKLAAVLRSAPASA
jgi:uncharacterized protein YndB with AHSA1/START domain